MVRDSDSGTRQNTVTANRSRRLGGDSVGDRQPPEQEGGR